MKSANAGRAYLSILAFYLVTEVAVLTAGIWYPVLLGDQVLQILSSVIVLVPVLIAALLTPAPLSALFPLRPVRVRTLLYSALLVLTLVLTAIAINLVTVPFTGNTVADEAEQLLAGGPLSTLLIVGLLAPVCEELVFRGYIFGNLRTAGKVKSAAVVSALLFALLHMNLNQAAYTFVIGILFALAMEVSGSLLVPLIMHAGFNSLECCLLFYGEELDARIASLLPQKAEELVERFLGAGDLTKEIILFSVLLLAVSLLLASLILLRIRALERQHREKRDENHLLPAEKRCGVQEPLPAWSRHVLTPSVVLSILCGAALTAVYELSDRGIWLFDFLGG